MHKKHHNNEKLIPEYYLNILIGLTYYRPHISGLTIYAQRMAEALSLRGHKVTVLTSQYDKTLSNEEHLNGVRIIRVPVAFRISKGVVMPSYLKYLQPLLEENDIVLINLPNTPIESLLLSLLARQNKRPLLAIYHCDVKLPFGILNKLIECIVHFGNLFACKFADKIIVYTEDYGDNCYPLKHFKSKCEYVLPPIVFKNCDYESIKAFRKKYAPHGENLIGFAARFASEKGIEYLLNALPIIQKEFPNLKVLFAGEHKDVVGEKNYNKIKKDILNRFRNQWIFLGVLDPDKMAEFYGACDVTVLPSINKTESFGLVQVESMLNGTPVVASDLPGVRVPVQMTNMGLLVTPRDSTALAEALVEVIQNQYKYVRPKKDIERLFSLEKTVSYFEILFEDLLRKAQHPE